MRKRIYPRWKYHAKLGGKVIRSQEEESKLESGWCDNSHVVNDKKMLARQQEEILRASQAAEDEAAEDEAAEDEAAEDEAAEDEAAEDEAAEDEAAEDEAAEDEAAEDEAAEDEAAEDEAAESPKNKYLSLDDLTKDEIKNILVEDYDVELSKINKLKKDDLIEMLKEKKALN